MQNLAPLGQYFQFFHQLCDFHLKNSVEIFVEKALQKNNFLGLSYSSILTFLHIMIIGNPFLTINKAKWGYPRFFIFIQSRDTEVGFTLRLHSLHQNPFPTISLGCFPPLRIPWSLDFNKNLKCPFCSYNKAKWKKKQAKYIRQSLILGIVWYYD